MIDSTHKCNVSLCVALFTKNSLKQRTLAKIEALFLGLRSGRVVCRLFLEPCLISMLASLKWLFNQELL